MLKLVRALSRNILTLHVINRILNRLKYPGISIAHNVNLNILGEFKYGHGCGIGTGANLIVPKGASLIIGGGCYIGRYVELGPGNKIAIGSYSSIQDRSIFVGDVTIGRYCLISLNVLISSGRHYYELQPFALIKDQDRFVAQNDEMGRAHSKPVVVEDDCWLGVNAVVMSGVTIGKGAIVGANSVVTKDVAPYSVVAGVPAKEIKRRLDFVPPSSIDYANPKHWPYFYSGFEVSQEERDRYSAHGGLSVRAEFELCLDNTSGDSIHLLIKNIGSQICRLKFENQEREVSNQFQEVIFENSGQRGKTTRLRMRPDIATAVMIVQKAWIE